MFTYEFRETVIMLVNVICAVAIIASISYCLQLKNKVGAAATETYLAQNTVEMHYEFNKYDGQNLTADECIAAFAQYINSGVKLCIIDSSINEYKSGVTYSVSDFRENSEIYSVEQIRLGIKNKATGGSGNLVYFNQNKIYEAYIGYDDEEPSTAQNKYYRDTNNDGILEPPVKERSVRPNRVSSITFIAKNP